MRIYQVRRDPRCWIVGDSGRGGRGRRGESKAGLFELDKDDLSTMRDSVELDDVGARTFDEAAADKVDCKFQRGRESRHWMRLMAMSNWDCRCLYQGQCRRQRSPLGVVWDSEWIVWTVLRLGFLDLVQLGSSSGWVVGGRGWSPFAASESSTTGGPSGPLSFL